MLHDSFQAFKNNSASESKYVPGVGTRFGFIGTIIGGAFGAGEVARSHEAYDFLCRCWSVGDHVTDIVGFSRAAATALDCCNLMNKRGIRGPDSETIVEPDPPIPFVAVWDVAAAFG